MNGRTKIPIDIDWIARSLEEARSVDSLGNVSFKGFLVDDLVLALATGLEFSEEIAEGEARNICRQAIFAVGRTAITGKGLQATIKRETQSFLRKTPVHFVLASSVTLSWQTKMRGARMGGANVSFCAQLPTSFDRSFLESLQGSRELADDSRLLKARVHVRARTTTSAIRDAMHALDFLRGTWNLSLNANRWREWSLDETKSVNQILPGPLHTLHAKTGKPIADEYWYEPFYSNQRGQTLSPSKLAILFADSIFIRRQCSNSLFKNDLEQMVIRYCRALDIRDPQLAFVKLWGLLEQLTGTTWTSYDKTIRRVLFLFSEEREHRYILEVLRDFRNRSVHSGFDQVGRENLIRLHGYVARVLLFALGSGRLFTSLDELGEFLSVPVDADRLLRKADLLRKAIRFRGVQKGTSRKTDWGRVSQI